MKKKFLSLLMLPLFLAGCGHDNGYIECQNIVVYRSYTETRYYYTLSYCVGRTGLYEYKNSTSGRKIYTPAYRSEGFTVNGWDGNTPVVAKYDFVDYIGQISFQERIYYNQEARSIITECKYGEYKGPNTIDATGKVSDNKKAARCINGSFYSGYGDDIKALEYGKPSSGATKRYDIQLGENTKVMYTPRVK